MVLLSRISLRNGFTKVTQFAKMASRNENFGYNSTLKPPSYLNGTESPDALSPAETSDSNSDISSTGERRLIHRSSLICSAGTDQFTFDCVEGVGPPSSLPVDHDASLTTGSEASSLSDRLSILSDGDAPVIKRDSMLHPGRLDLQRSLCVNGRFQNPWPTWRPPSITNIFKFGLSKDYSNVPSKQELDLVLPIITPNFNLYGTPPDEGIRVTWIGHATVLVQIHGMNILTDPIFSERASPSKLLGPKRYRDPPCTVQDLPQIDAVVISHNHYDHLDLTTVTLLNSRFDKSLRWFVPLGLASWMDQVGCENVVELDWWEENCVPEHSDVSFVLTPAQHWCKRTIADDNKVLWGSWSIIGPKYKFFFAGDTGYCDVFKQIGQIYGPFDLAAIPIGAYEPRWFMKYQHVNPEEAVMIHEDIESKATVAIHWGTFSLANEYYLDPPVRLRESLDKRNISPETFFTLRHGESRWLYSSRPQGRSRRMR